LVPFFNAEDADGAQRGLSATIKPSCEVFADHITAEAFRAAVGLKFTRFSRCNFYVVCGGMFVSLGRWRLFVAWVCGGGGVVCRFFNLALWRPAS
jgi:hypothetical protein